MNCGPVGTLAVHGLAIAGPSGDILRGISFHVPQGAVVCLLGETGTGKSLIAQALLGLLPHGLRAEGTLSLPDGACFDLAAPHSLHALWGHALFLLPQEPFAALDPTARLLGQVAEAVPLPDRRTRRLSALRRLAGFGLDRTAAQKIPTALSGGMAQRGLLAIAAEVAAPVLIVDEPTKGLDALRRGEAAAMLRDGGRTLIVITHDLALPAELGADLLVLHDGCVVEHGPAETVLAAPTHPWTRRLIDAQPARWQRRNASPPGPALISATGLGFAWPGRPTLFRGIDLTLRRGGILGLAGPSGAGKSTLCDLMLGLLPPDQGTISWQGTDPAAMPRRRRDAERQRFQKLYQDPVSAFPPHRVLRRVFADLAAVTDDPLARLPALLERLHLRQDVLDRRVTEISGGEAQRLALARALLLRPLALIADEPTSRLDAVTQADIALLLREQVEREGMALLLVSHDAALLDAMADEVVRLS